MSLLAPDPGVILLNPKKMLTRLFICKVYGKGVMCWYQKYLFQSDNFETIDLMRIKYMYSLVGHIILIFDSFLTYRPSWFE